MAFELGLAAVALVVGLALNHAPLEFLRLDPPTLAQLLVHAVLGWAAAVPLLAGLVATTHSRWPPLVRLRQVVLGELIPIFRGCSRWQLLVMSTAAGFGEELLFRGLLQQLLVDRIGGPAGVVIGLVVASMVFGLAHAITWAYALFATLVGAYLGLLFWFTSTLWAPLVAHAAYDYLALGYLLQRLPPSPGQGP